MGLAAHPYAVGAAIVVAGAVITGTGMTASALSHPAPDVGLTAAVAPDLPITEDLQQVGSEAHSIVSGEVEHVFQTITNPASLLDPSGLFAGIDPFGGVNLPEFDAGDVLQVLTGLDPSVFELPGIGGGLFTPVDPGTAAATGALSAAPAAGLQGLASALQDVVGGFNGYLTGGEDQVVDALGGDTMLAGMAGDVFGLQNALLAYQEELLNQLLGGQGLDIDTSALTTPYDADLTALLGDLDMNGQDWVSLFNTVDLSDLYQDMLTSLDISSAMPDFSDVFSWFPL